MINKHQEKKVFLEFFNKTDLEKYLDNYFGSESELTLIYNNIEKTYTKYLYKYGTDNITVLTNLISPQVYKVGMFEIKIKNYDNRF